MINILERITQYREERHWTEYQLSQNSQLPQSTISSWYRKQMLPSLGSLEKICNAFGVTLSQFLADDSDPVIAEGSQIELLHQWDRMDAKQQETLLHFLKSL